MVRGETAHDAPHNFDICRLLDVGREARVIKNWHSRCLVGLVFGFLTSLAVGACGDEGEAPPKKKGPPERVEAPSAKVSVQVVYPNEAAQKVVGSLHLWVVSQRPNIPDAGEPLKFTCSSLVGGETDPYDVRIVRLTDVVSNDISSRSFRKRPCSVAGSRTSKVSISRATSSSPAASRSR